ncbi:helix-turn-helix domain-containing protein [Paenibacillus sp. MY03]|uniref:helix-turn-helix domain-containing protein n=1 Tax=Paenibacillus sp. MY03 TaxID=302980 RepID=UPI0015C5F3B1|nr:helix-turn-helix domain-containing protein [Paenibacillus sp. MY03]
MKRNMAYKIQMIYASLFILIIASTVLISYISGTERLEREVIDSNLQMLNQINKRMESTLEEIDRAIIQMLQTGDAAFFFNTPRTGDPEYLIRLDGIQSQISGLKRSYPVIQSMYLYSRANEMLLSEELYNPTSEETDKHWISTFYTENFYYKWTANPLFMEKNVNRHTVTLIRFYPMADKPKNRKGVIAVNLPETILSDMFSDLQFGNSGNVLITDEQGTILSHADKSRIGRNIAEYKLGGQLLFEKDSGFTRHKNGKASEWVFYSSSAYTGWKLVYVVSQGQMSGLFLAIRNILLALAGIMVLLSVGSVVLVNKTWFTPMERFINKVESLFSKRDGGTATGAGSLRPDFNRLEGTIRDVLTGYSDAVRQLQESKPALKLQILFDIVTGHRTRYDLAKPYFDHIGLELYLGHYIVMIAELDNKVLLEKISDLNPYLYAVCNVAEELMKERGEALKGGAVQINEYQAVILISFLEEDAVANMEQAVTFAQSLLDAVQKYIKHSVSIGIGSYSRRFADIKDSYQAAQECIHYKLVAGPGTIITGNDISALDGAGLMELFDLADQLQEAVWQTNPDKVAELLSAIFVMAAQCRFADKTMVQFALQLIYRTGKKVADPALLERLQSGHTEIEGRLARTGSLSDMREYLLELMEYMVEALVEKRNSKTKADELIARITAYISLHYGQSGLSLNLLSEEFAISSNHLSKIFKQSTGINFVDYVIAIRMQEAQKLLLEGPSTVNQIAEQVGYTNVTSFMRSFKKFSGMTPSEYRQAERA